MEPITIIATLGSLVKLTWELNRKLNQFTHTWKTTSPAILAINNEISDLTVVLDHARTAQLAVFRSDETSSFVPALQCHLEQAERLLLQLDDFIARIEQEAGFKRKWKWLLKNPRVGEFQHGLRSVRERICELMTAYNVSAVSRIQLELKAIHTDVLIRNAQSQAIHRPTTDSQAVAEKEMQSAKAERRSNKATPVQGLSYQELGLALQKLLGPSEIDTKLDAEDKMREILEVVASYAKGASLKPPPSPALPRLPQPDYNLSQPPNPPRRRPDLHKISARTVGGGYTMPTITFKARARGPVLCQNGCDCRCHLTYAPQVRIRSAFIGALFVGYSGYPIHKADSCDDINCRERGRTHIEVHYSFPLWFLPLTVSAVFQKTLTGGPKFGLVIRKVTDHVPGGISQAIQFSDLETLKHHLSIDPEAANSKLHGYSWSMIQTAVRISSSKEIHLALLQAGANPDQEDDRGSNAGIFAAEKVLSLRCPPHLLGFYEELFPLSKYLDALEFSHLTKLIIGIHVGSPAKLLATRSPSVLEQLDARDFFGYTPLYWAVMRGDVANTKALLTAGADPNVHVENGQATLRYALELPDAATSTEIVDALTAHGANLTFVDDFGQTPFLWACRSNRVNFARRMVETGRADVNARQRKVAQVPAIAIACSGAGTETLEYLIAAGADIEATDKHGTTPLENAVFKNATNCVRVLLAAGADYLHVEPMHRWTLLTLAAVSADVATMDALAAHGLAGLDVEAVDGQGKTAAETFAQRRGGQDAGLKAAFERLVRAVERAGLTDSAYCSETEDVFYDAEE